MAIPTAAPEQTIASELWNKLAGLVNGTAARGEPVQFIDYTSAINPSLSVRNQNTAGTGLRVYNGTLDILTTVNDGTNSGYATAANLYQKGPRAFDHLAFSGADDTEKINNALAHIRSNCPDGAILRLNKNQIVINDTINAAHLNYIVIEAAGGAGGTFLYANEFSSSKPVIDLTGSSSFKIVNVVVGYQSGSGASIPNVGFLIAASSTRSSNKGEMFGCGSVGEFTVAPLYIYGGSNHALYSCGFQQNQPGGACAHLTLDNVASVTSPYQTIATGTSNSTSDLLFVGCEFHTHSDTTTRTAVNIRGVSVATFVGGIIDAYGSSSTFVALTTVSGSICNAISFRSVRFYKDQPGTVGGTAITVNEQVDGLTIDQCSIQSGINNLVLGASGSIVNGLTVLGDVTSYGFSGNIVTTAGGSGPTINGGLIMAGGCQINVGAGAITSNTVIIDAGTLTATTNNAIATQSNTLRIPGGSTSAPGLARNDDPDTGVVLEGGNVGSLSAGNTQIMKWSAAGIQVKRLYPSGVATNLSTGDFGSLHANWGSGASCSAVTGTEVAGTFTITAGGSGTGANPTLVFTYPGGAYAAAPAITCNLTGGTGMGGTAVPVIITPGTSSCTFQMMFTPATSATYRFTIIKMG